MSTPTPAEPAAATTTTTEEKKPLSQAEIRNMILQQYDGATEADKRELFDKMSKEIKAQHDRQDKMDTETSGLRKDLAASNALVKMHDESKMATFNTLLVKFLEHAQAQGQLPGMKAETLSADVPFKDKLMDVTTVLACAEGLIQGLDDRFDTDVDDKRAAKRQRANPPAATQPETNDGRMKRLLFSHCRP